MKFIVNQKELNNALNIALKAISNKNLLEILRGVLIEAIDDHLTITTNNLEIGIKTKIDANIIIPGRIILDAKIFSDIIKKIPNQDIEIDAQDETKIQINSGFVHFTIKGIKDTDFPEIEDHHIQEYQEIPKETLTELIKKTHFAASIDETKPLLMGELIEIDQDSINVVAIDGFRLATKKTTIQTTVEPKKIVILKRILVEIMSLIQNIETPVKIGFNNREITFIMDNTTLTARALEGEFVNYRQIIPTEFQTEIKLQNKTLIDSLERASLVSNKNLVKMEIQDGNLTITTQNDEIGNFQETIQLEHTGKPLKIAFNIRYILEALKNIEDQKITIKLNTNVSPCIIRPENDPDYTYLLLPVRI